MCSAPDVLRVPRSSEQLLSAGAGQSIPPSLQLFPAPGQAALGSAGCLPHGGTPSRGADGFSRPASSGCSVLSPELSAMGTWAFIFTSFTFWKGVCPTDIHLCSCLVEGIGDGNQHRRIWGNCSPPGWIASAQALSRKVFVLSGC